jgi:predicted nucleic acid-binding protein
MFLLDSTFLIDLHDDLRRGDGAAKQFMRKHRTQPMVITPVTATEYAVGIRHEREARRFLRRFRILPLGRDVALAAARVDRDQMARGLRLGENDTWQVAVALYFDFTLISADSDFAKVTGLKRIDYTV